MITKTMLKKGYEDGIVRLVESPHDDGVVCQIGDYWFYFGGQTAEESTVNEYIKNVPTKEIIDEIKTALEDIKANMDTAEYGYYEAVLKENAKQEDRETYGSRTLLKELMCFRNELAHETAESEKVKLKGTPPEDRIKTPMMSRSQVLMELNRLIKEYGDQPNGGFKRYFMIVTSEDDRYRNGQENSKDLTYWVDNPWDGLLVETAFGNDIDELFGDGENEGLFYQLFSTITGHQISYGVLDPDSPADEMEEYDEFIKEEGLAPGRWYGNKPTNGKFCMITFSKALLWNLDDDRNDTFSTENPWHGRFDDVFYGDSADDLCYGSEENRYYQLFSTETGKCISYGKYSRSEIHEKLEEYQKVSKELAG